MSRGPTQRVERLVVQGEASSKLLAAADREADLLGHPYIGVEHVELARLRLAGREAECDGLRAQLTPGLAAACVASSGPAVGPSPAGSSGH